MKLTLGTLAVAAGLLAAPPSLALPTQNPYHVTVGGVPSGTMMFDLDQEVPGACRYAMQWGFSAVPSEQCFVDEITVPPFRNCLMAALMPLLTFVNLPPPGVPCRGTGADGQSAPVFTLSAVEQPPDGRLDGLVQFDSFTAYFLAFHAAPVQEGTFLNGANAMGGRPNSPHKPAIAIR